MYTWTQADIQLIYDIMSAYAPWRGNNPWDDAEFMASWLNNAQILDPLNEENLVNWWKSTEEYQNEWPKWNEPLPPDPPDPEPEPPIPPNPSFQAIQGQLRLDDAGYCDDVNRVLPIGLHLGDIFSKFTRDPIFAESLVQTARNAGYPIIQFWMNLGTLGGNYWLGRECGPGFTSDFWGQLSKFGDLLDKYGMKGGYNLGDYKLREGTHSEFFAELGRQLRVRENQTAAYVFGGNEAWQTGASSKEEISDALDAFKAENNEVIVTTTSPPSEHSEEIEKWCDGDFYAIHGYRGGEDHDRIRHIFSVMWEGNPPTKYGYQDEPTGPGSEVSVKPPHCYTGRDVDANHMCALAVQSVLSNQAFNYFCSEGVKSDGDITKRAGYYEVGGVRKILPIDIMSWPKAFHFGNSQSAHRVFSPVSGNSFRFDHRVSHDGRIFGLFYGDQGQSIAKCERGCYLSFVDWDGTVHPEAQFDRDQQLVINFARSQNGQPGYTAQAVIGRLR